MDLTLLQRDHWHGGQLLAFSGLDGKTDFFQGLTARTAFDAPAIDIKFPGACRLLFPAPRRVLLAGDFFEIGHGRWTGRAARSWMPTTCWLKERARSAAQIRR